MKIWACAGLAILIFCNDLIKAGDLAVFERLTTTVTNLAASSTSTNAATQKELFQNPKTFRLYLKAEGVGASTNGSLTAYVSTSFDSNNWDTASLSFIKVTMSSLGSATNQVSDWFTTDNIRYIRVGRIENTFVGPVSNVTVHIAYEK